MKKSTKTAVILISAGCILTLICAAIHTWLRVSERFDAPDAVRIYIPRDATVESVTDTLRTRLGDEFGATVSQLWEIRKGNPSTAYGSYVITPGDRAWSIASRLKAGRQTPIRLTFNNIRLYRDFIDRVSSRFDFTDKELLVAADSVLTARGYKSAAEYPAAFLPDTYEFYWTASPAKVITTLADERDRFWTDERRDKAKALGLHPVEVATIASIVEEETGRDTEKPTVARLYLNRLEKGMKLQADPTVKFALGNFALRRIGGSMLQIDSPYNTYRYAGLPPGPIRIVERSTLSAVLDAPEHDYLYMCAKPDFSGYHNFTSDYNAHLANARAYQRELNKRNIR